MCQHLYVYFDEAHHRECIRSKPPNKVGKIAKKNSSREFSRGGKARRMSGWEEEIRLDRTSRHQNSI
jgi:hypothetical protein